MKAMSLDVNGKVALGKAIAEHNLLVSLMRKVVRYTTFYSSQLHDAHHDHRNMYQRVLLLQQPPPCPATIETPLSYEFSWSAPRPQELPISSYALCAARAAHDLCIG